MEFGGTRRLIALSVAVALAAATCSDDSGQLVDDGGASEGTVATGDLTATTLVPPPPTDPPEVPQPMFGDLAIPCGADGALGVVDDVGLDPETITIGTGNDRGGLATLNSGRGISDVVVALADHCNSLGGLAGREIVVMDLDAAAVETRERVGEACETTLALVGYRYLREAEAVTAAARCDLPLFPAGPLRPSPLTLQGHLLAVLDDPAGATSVALLGPDTPSAILDRARRALALAASPIPIEVVADLTYPTDQVPDWPEIVGVARAAGAGLVQLEGGCDHAVIPFLEAASAAGWHPTVLATTTAYDPACLVVPDLVERLLIETPFLPFEDADAAPATATAMEVIDAIGGPRTGDALLGASAFWRFAVAAVGCDAELGRACLTAHESSFEGWTSGGLHPALSSDGAVVPCVVVLGIENGAFVRRLPVEPGSYDCTPEWSVPV